MAENQLTTKRCYVCKAYKPLPDFNRSKREKDGHRAECRECQNAYNRRWDKATRPARREVKRAWQRANPDKVAAYHKRWAQNNAEHLTEYNKRYHTERPGLRSEWARARYMKDPQRILEYNRSYRPKLREWETAYRRTYRLKNKELVANLSRAYKARKRGAEGSHTERDVQRIRAQQSGKCAYCRRALGADCHVDHIKPISKGGSNWPSNLQILCAPCNTGKKDRDPIDHARRLGLLI